MKKLVSIVMVVTVLFSLAACSRNTANENSTTTSQQSDVPNSKSEDSTSEDESNQQNDSSTSTEEANSEKDSSASLVVYFSWSGNTENVANEIASQTGADIFEIVPKTPYTDDYDAVVDLAKQEQSDNARPEIAKLIENIDEYDVIYVGFPNWWADMPMILYTFFDTYDLSGKTIAPFCTSGGSGLSNTVSEIKSLEPNATVTEGLHIGSGAADNPTGKVTDWLQSIGFNN